MYLYILLWKDGSCLKIGVSERKDYSELEELEMQLPISIDNTLAIFPKDDENIDLLRTIEKHLKTLAKEYQGTEYYRKTDKFKIEKVSLFALLINAVRVFKELHNNAFQLFQVDVMSCPHCSDKVMSFVKYKKSKAEFKICDLLTNLRVE